MSGAIDFCQLLRVSQRLHEHVDFRDFPRHIIECIESLIGSDVCSYGEIDTLRLNAATVSNHPESVAPGLVDSWAEHTLGPEILVHWKGFRPHQVTKFTDHLDDEQIERLPIYQHYYREFGVFYQIMLPFICRDDVVLSIGFSRERGERDFGPEDRDLLVSLGPVLAQAYEHAQARALAEQGIAKIGSGLRSVRSGLIVLSEHGRVETASAAARAWVVEYFGSFPGYSARLPAALQAWLDQQITKVPMLRRSLVRERDERSLTVCLAGTLERGNLALVLQHREPIPVEQLVARLGLTPRRAEVLCWAAMQKTNSEIGAILAISDRTVQKHLEHIFAELEVCSRNEAIERCIELLTFNKEPLIRMPRLVSIPAARACVGTLARGSSTRHARGSTPGQGSA